MFQRTIGVALWGACLLPAFGQVAERYTPTALYDSLTPYGLAYEALHLPLAPGQAYTLAYCFGAHHEGVAPATGSPTPGADYPEQPVVLGPTVVENGQRYQVLYRYGAQLTAEGTLRTYDWVEYGLNPVAQPQSAQPKANRAATASVLASGNWYQLGVPADGVYRIDRSVLQALGLNPDAVDSRNLRLYGNGTGLLPQPNAAPRPDDLVENALVRVGLDDGTFGTADYALFFGRGPGSWRYDTPNARFYYENHPYSDSSYYYLTFDRGAGGLTVTEAVTPEGDLPTTEAVTLDHVEVDAENPGKSGRQWLGPAFVGTSTRTENLHIPTTTASVDLRFRARFAARSSSASTITYTVGGNAPFAQVIGSVNTSSLIDPVGQQLATDVVLGGAAGTVPVGLSFATGLGGEGWLDWLELEARHTAPAVATQADFWVRPLGGSELRLPLSVGTGLSVWDVTRPTRVQSVSVTDGIRLVADTVRRYWVFGANDPRTPTAIGRVANQNLHGLPQANYLMVVYPGYLPAATRLADFHRSRGLSVHVVTTQQVYHEFGSGAQDVTAIRDFVRLFYQRADGDPELQPKYLLLFGDGSYDNRGRVTDRSRVVTYQSRESLVRTGSYVSDDYFGLLDDTEGQWGEASGDFYDDTQLTLELVDLGIGRLPARSLAEAEALVDKVIGYATGPSTAGSWQNRVLLLGDYKESDGTIHISQANTLGDTLAVKNSCLNLSKVYLEQFPVTRTGSVLLFPEARAEALRQLDNGALVVNYTGHGSEVSLSNSGIFNVSDVGGLKNEGREAFWITATCEFGRYDDPEATTGAEALLLKPTGGAIGALTSVRLVFSFPNFVFNRNWHRFSLAYDPLLGRYPTLGEVYRQAKNSSFPQTNINTRNFALLADPALTLAIPQDRVVLTGLQGQAPGTADTLRALETVRLAGEVQSATGERLTNFSGVVELTVYDKAQSFSTLLTGYTYQAYRSVLFRGSVTVTAGAFEISFVLPLDLEFSPGTGNLQLVAVGPNGQALGCSQDVTLCCVDPEGATDTAPPTAEVFLGDFNWRSGGTVDPNPLFLALVTDNLGINPSGQGIGRELLLTLDNDPTTAVNVGDAYQANQDDPTQGSLRYPLSGLSPGRHTLELRVWDVANNTTTAQTEFWVADGSALSLAEVVAYPNPYSPSEGPLRLRLQTSQPGENLVLALDLVSITGQTVARWEVPLDGEGYVQLPTLPEGFGPGGSLAAGVYVLRLKVTNPDTGAVVEATERLVVVAR